MSSFKDRTMRRSCGGCTLCCKLLPIPDLGKKAGARCQHQRTGKGCAIYKDRPSSCALWNCRWLINDDTADLRRPDRARYVIDVAPDFITVRRNDESEPPVNIKVIQIWVDPHDRDAWKRDPALDAYMERRGREGIATIIRFSSREATVVIPPSMSEDGQWHATEPRSIANKRSDRERRAGVESAVPFKFPAPPTAT